MKKLLVGLLAAVALSVVPAHATCTGTVTVTQSTSGATADQGTLSGVSGCYLIITNVTADLANVNDGSAFETTVVAGNSCTSNLKLGGFIGVGSAFGTVNHFASGPIHVASALGASLCVGFGGGQTGNEEYFTVTYDISPTQ